MSTAEDVRDRVQICGLRVRCVVGVNPEERHREQSLLVDLELGVDTRPAGLSGRIGDTCDYDVIADQVTALLRFRHYRLLENAAEELAAMVVGVHPSVQTVSVRLEKPRALEGRARAAAVQVHRTRADFPMRHESPAWGAVDILFESKGAGLYLLHVDPGASIPPHYHQTMRELEWVVSGELERAGRDVRTWSSPLAPVVWPHGRIHGYTNHSDARATLFCCDEPPFIPSDEVVVPEVAS